ncbi:MAG: CrcB family protein [Alphaproteobacteria bacterium]|nr:CrcB family protein [Alphaproteobacteria bacterium]
MKLLWVFAGGGAGACSRYLMSVLVGRWAGHMPWPKFPWHTLSVNVLGALIIGALAEYFALRVSHLEHARLLLITGFLGGFTTFSAFSLESALMWEKGDYLSLSAYVGLSVAGTIIAVLCGGGMMRAVL